MTFNVFKGILKINKRTIAALVIALSTATVLVSAPIQVPNIFQEGDIISAEEVNANFQVLQERINQLSEDLASFQVEVLPVGTIVPFAGTSDKIPAGWLLCDGSSLVKTGDYAALYAIIASNYGAEDGDHYSLPDLRGVFLRGHDPDAAKDVDAAGRIALRPDLTFYSGNTGNTIGSYQEDLFSSHNHDKGSLNITNSGSHSHRSYLGGLSYGEINRFASASFATSYSDYTESATHTHPNSTFSGNVGFSGGNETRVKNVAINYIVKYK